MLPSFAKASADRRRDAPRNDDENKVKRQKVKMRKMKFQGEIIVLGVAALLIIGGCGSKKALEESKAATAGLKKQVELLQRDMKTQEKKLEKTRSLAKQAQYEKLEADAKMKELQKKLTDSYKEREGKVQKFLQEIGLNKKSITAKAHRIGILEKKIAEKDKQVADLKKELSVVSGQLSEKTGQVIDLKAKLKNAETRNMKSE